LLIAFLILFGINQIQAQTHYIDPDQQFQFNCNGVVTLNIINNNPGLNIMQDATTGLLGTNSNFDPGAGTLEIIFGTVEGPASYGTISYLVDDNGVQSTFNIYIIDCCIKNLNPDLIVLNEATSSLPNPNLANQKVLVLEEFFIDDPAVMFRCDFYMGADASIQLQPGTSLTLEQCTIVNFCGYRWDGILAQNENTEIQIIDSEIRGAGRGVFLEDDVQFEASNSLFIDNAQAVAFKDYNQTGSYYNNSRMEITGNTFEAILARIDFHPTSTVVSKLTQYTWGCANCQYFINMLNSNTIQIGNRFKAKNLFTGQDAQAILGANSSFTIENNKFENVANSIRANLCVFKTGGRNPGYGNEFINTSFIESSYSSQSIRNNYFFNAGCNIWDPTQYLVDGSLGSQIDSNQFSVSELNCSSSQNPMLNNVNIRIRDNKFYDSHTTISNIQTNSLAIGISLTNNFFGSSGNVGSTSGRLKLVITPGIRVGYNDFRDIPGVPGAGTWGELGLYLDNVQDAQIKGNYFELNTTAIFGTNDLSNTTISCNTFDGCNTSMSFKEAILTDFGTSTEGAENSFNAVYGTSNGTIILWNNPGSNFIWQPFTYYFTTISSPGSTWYADPDFPGGAGVPLFLIPFPMAINNASGYSSTCGTLNKHDFDETKNQSFKIYPNPSSGFFKVLTQENDEFSEIRIYDLHGKLLYSFNEKLESYTTNIASGVYIVKIIKKNGEDVSQRLIISK